MKKYLDLKCNVCVRLCTVLEYIFQYGRKLSSCNFLLVVLHLNFSHSKISAIFFTFSMTDSSHVEIGDISALKATNQYSRNTQGNNQPVISCCCYNYKYMLQWHCKLKLRVTFYINHSNPKTDQTTGLCL